MSHFSRSLQMDESVQSSLFASCEKMFMDRHVTMTMP
ncbi:hypothetical protein BBFGKLBO_02581 [Synechococcus sp. CBW1107]|nr:hypothetical protein BBFGKLBO_02581 [Synechococcus sp. CBW1107]